MNSLVNLTPHEIHFRNSQNLEEVIFTLPSSGVARVHVTRDKVGDIDGFSVFVSRFGKVEGLPSENPEGKFFIVSALTVQAAKAEGHVIYPYLLTVDQTVRMDKDGNLNLKEGNIVGCLSLGKI
jgi:hypothetical protein